MGSFQFIDFFMNQHTWNSLSIWYLLLPFSYATILGICIWRVHHVFQHDLKSFDSSFLFAIALLSTSLSLCLNWSFMAIIPILFLCILCIVVYRNIVLQDMIFVFWSISIGFMIGMGIYLAAFLTTAILKSSFVYRYKHQKEHYMLNFRCFDERSEQLILKEVMRESEFYEIHTQVMNEQGISITMLVIMKKGQHLIDKLSQIKGVESLQIMTV